MNTVAQTAAEAARVLRVADTQAPLAPDTAALAAAAAELLGVAAAEARLHSNHGDALATSDRAVPPSPRPWWQRLFGR